MRRWLGLVVIASCQQSSSAPPPAPIPTPIDAAVAPPIERAYVIDDTGLVEVSAGSAHVIGSDAIAWCDADARANVVWYETGDGLFAFDLETRTSLPIIKGDLGQVEPIIDWGNEQLGGENKLELRVGIAIHMGSASLSTEIGCEGDAAVYCFQADGKTPSKELAAQQRIAKHLTLVDRSVIARLAARGASRSLWTPPPMPTVAPKPPKIDPARCTEIPDDCGRLTAIPGSSLWLVATQNSRGDYFHETRELWDPATGEFVKAVKGRIVRSKQPASEGEITTDYANMRVSPLGGLSFDGFVFDPHRVIYAPNDFGKTCGWSSGGWRIKWGGE
ncbi:MAG TPA: hypothetical protein VGG28_34040 [Kofleriaceae bacterium]|jgi:hypothetical protein